MAKSKAKLKAKSAKAKAKTSSQKSTGKLKAWAGKITGNRKLRARGKSDQATASTKKAGRRIKDLVH